MPYRNRLQTPSVAENPQQLQIVWREERALRIGRAFCVAGIVLSMVATIADFFWSAPAVVATDLILLLGCGISFRWLRSPSRPIYYWWPLYGAFWISTLPSLWLTGGLNSPFFAIDLAALYVVGAVMDVKNYSLGYAVFAFLHVPIFYFVEHWYPLSGNVPPPLMLTSIISTVTLMAIVVCVNAMLRTEKELSLEFTSYFRNLSKTEAELKKREFQLREAQSIARMGNWEWDLEADLITWSDELFKIFDVSKDQFDPSFKAYMQRLNPNLREKVSAIIESSFETGEDFSFENRITTRQGDRFILSRGRVVKNAGRTTKMWGTSQDITDRKLTESELVDARRDLEQRVEERTLQLEQSLEREKSAKEFAENANQAKMQFLANMSHEIRTPMNSILGFSELLSLKEASSENQEYLERIRANGTQLLYLIDDILDLSKFEAGNIPIQQSVFSLRTAIDEVVNSFLPSLKAKGLDIQLFYRGETSANLVTDRLRLNQVLINLLGNAIKFSEKGTIQLTVSCHAGASANEMNLMVDVEDAGIGISDENQKSLFQPFSQGDPSIARKYGGSGLGLALSKRIAGALGGNLELRRSQAGQGSHFRFQIAVMRATEEDVAKMRNPNSAPIVAGEDSSKPFQQRSILIVEDSPDNAKLLVHYFNGLGAKIEIATDGLKAVQRTLEKTYDCILMDVQMPGMDGLEATRRIRSQGYLGPIIALTAHALPSEAAKSLAAGCNLHLTKPIQKSVLIFNVGEQMKQN